MKKEYIRSTHYFDNKTRTWIYRGDRGQDRPDWNDPELITKVCTRPCEPKNHSMGVHALRDHMWMDIKWIVSETLKMYYGGADGEPTKFKEWYKNTPNARELIQKDIEEELEMLIKLDMVQVRETPSYDEYRKSKNDSGENFLSGK